MHAASAFDRIVLVVSSKLIAVLQNLYENARLWAKLTRLVVSSQLIAVLQNLHENACGNNLEVVQVQYLKSILLEPLYLPKFDKLDVSHP